MADMPPDSNYVLRAWQQDAEGGQTYRLRVQFPRGDHPGREMVALVEWGTAADGAAPKPETFIAHKRVYLQRGEGGWSGTCTAPVGTRQMRLLVYRWPWVGSGVVGHNENWTFTCQRVPALPPRITRAAVAYQQTTPDSPATMEARRAVMIATIHQAGARNVGLLVLSENFLDRHVALPVQASARALDDPWMEPIYDAVREAQLYAVFAFNEKRSAHRHITAVLVTPQGRVLETYRKRHLTQAELESGVTPGDNWMVSDTPLGRIGMLICWDGWFPGSAAALARRGAEIICFPLAGDGEKKHWDYIWRARALDHQVYWLASVTGDCGGEAPSRIIAPTGEVLAETREPNSLACADLRLPVVDESYWLSVGPFWSEIRNVYQHEEIESTRCL